MKLKFRADAKDLAIFVIFCIFLLYFVAIAVLNLSTFANENTFHGLNPLPAFTKEYIVYTLLFFAIALIAIMTSVSSYFFDMEKGFGITTNAKKEKGYSRWCTDKEMKKQLKVVMPNAESSDIAGIPLINDGKKIWVDSGEYHNLIIGSTGSGKTEMIVQPMVKLLAKKGESMIITDPKGEIYEMNANELRERGYNIVLLNFRDPAKGNAWNPLTLPYELHKSGNQDKSIELLEDLALNILYDESSKGQDPFWEKTSADYFTGLALALFDDAKEDEINLNSINVMTTAGEDKIGNTTYIKEYFSDKDQASSAYINVASTIMAPNDTKSSILSVFKQKIKLFSSRENLSEMLSHSDFDMEDIGRKKTAVFIVVQDEKKTYHSLVTIFLKQCYETLIRVAQETGGKLPYKTNFILDEFANMPPLKDVTTMVTAARSRRIRFTFIIQNFAQLHEVYGKENGETIKGNCGNIVYLISSELGALEEISKLCGEVKSKEKDKTASTPLVTVSDLQRLPFGTMIVLRLREWPFKTKMTPNFKMVKDNSWGKNYPLADYPVREKKSVPVFNIKAYVDKKKEEKINKMLGEFNNPNSSAGGNQPFPSSPFGPTPNPFGGAPASNPFGPSPFAGQPPMFNSPAPNSDNFNVDELVKRIDAKIAELEEEERREKEKLNNQQIVDIKSTSEMPKDINNSVEKIISEPVSNSIPVENSVVTPIVENKPVENIPQEPIIENIPQEKIQKEEKITNIPVENRVEIEIPKQKIEKYVEKIESKDKNYVTDDQFFDDFFSDDE